jgi:UDP-glucose:(heptosyl)LPS alpha-1,3-glucosyltransferase
MKLRELDVDVSHDMGCTWAGDIFHSHVGSPRAFYRSLLGVRPWWKRLGSLRIARRLPRYRETDRLIARQYAESRSAVFVALSKKICHDYQSIHRIAPHRIFLIHNGVDTDQFRPCDDADRRAACRSSLGLANEDLVFLQVARNPELKGVGELIQAAGRIRRAGTNSQVVVVGCRPHRRLRRRIENAGMSDCVRFVPKTREIETYYHLADACVHASHYDACSLTVLEAMACGLPVITTRCNGVSDLLTDGKDGFVLDRPDDPKLPGYLRALACRTTRLEMGREARSTALQNRLEQNFERTLALYERVAERKRGENHRSVDPLAA